MRFAQLLMIATTAVAAATLSLGCDQSDSNTGSLPPSSSSNSSARPTTTRRALPTTDEIFARTPAATSPTTRSARTPTTSDSNDPLATPESAVAHLFGLMEKEDVLGVRAMIADPSQPLNKLSGEVSAVAERIRGGAKWEIVESRTDGVASLVIFRTTFPDGRVDLSPIVLVNRYERWKALLGPLNLKKFAPYEKEDMNKVLTWGGTRLAELRGGTPATKPTTAATKTTPTD
jgi:hypothetical protein